MESNYAAYDYLKSFDRIQEILNASDLNFEELNSIPSRDKLTFTNGYYVYCSALFADIRGSSELTSKYKRPTLARIYRAYISEVVAILNGSDMCREIVIAGDCVSGIFDTPYKQNIDEVFGRAYTINSMIKVLNYRLTKRGIEQIKVGIGMSYGRALMVKAGHSGTAVNDVVWMGDVVNEACKLGDFGNASYSDEPIMVSSLFRGNLNEDNQNLLRWNANRNCYHGNVIRKDMEQWYDDNCK